MMDLMIDSCVFFRMIDYNNFVNVNGVEKLDKFIKSVVNRKDKLGKKLIDSFGEEYNSQCNGLSDEEKIEGYKKYAKKKEKEYSKNNNQGKEQHNDFISYADVYKDIEKYKRYLQSIKSGMIYRGAVRGEYKLYIPFVAYKEVMSHTKPKKNGKWTVFEKAEVLSLTKKCFTLVTTKSPVILDKIEKLAEAYRTPRIKPGTKIEYNKKGKIFKIDRVVGDREMKDHKNGVKDYGDSKIAAVANLMGMMLVTHNGRDFVFEYGKGKDQNIRNHVKKENEICDFATDAVAHTSDELLKGDYQKPTEERKINAECKKSRKKAFDEEIEMF